MSFYKWLTYVNNLLRKQTTLNVGVSPTIGVGPSLFHLIRNPSLFEGSLVKFWKTDLQHCIYRVIGRGPNQSKLWITPCTRGHYPLDRDRPTVSLEECLTVFLVWLDRTEPKRNKGHVDWRPVLCVIRSNSPVWLCQVRPTTVPETSSSALRGWGTVTTTTVHRFTKFLYLCRGLSIDLVLDGRRWIVEGLLEPVYNSERLWVTGVDKFLLDKLL